MNEPQTTMKLFAKVAKASRLITHVPKNGYNDHHRFHFATHDDVSDAAKKAMDEVGLVLIPMSSTPHEIVVPCTDKYGKEKTTNLTRVTVRYLLADPDSGESQIIEWNGDGFDTQDKALYKGYTQARKTLLLNLFLIPTGDREADGDYGHGYDQKPSGNKGQNKSKPAPSQSNNRQQSRNDAAPRPATQPSQNTAPQMFRDIPEDRKAKARAKFWAVSGKLWGDDGETKAREFCKSILAAGPDGKPSMTASTVEQVSAAINAIDKHHLTQTALNGAKN